MKFTVHSSQLTVVVVISCALFFASAASGCASFSRKFTRKPKEEKEVRVVVETQDYASKYSTAELYKKYYLYWRLANNDLLNLLDNPEINRKKLIAVSGEIAKNLGELRRFLQPEKQARINEFISETNRLGVELGQDLNRARVLEMKSVLLHQQRQMRAEFALKKVQDYLVEEEAP